MDNYLSLDDFEIYQQWSIEAEQSVLGAILRDNSKLPDLRELLNKDDFFDIRHTELFGVIESLDDEKKPIDVMTVIHQMQSMNKYEFIGGMEYLAQLAHQVPSTSNILTYANVVKGKSNEREVIKLSERMKMEITGEKGTSEERVNNALSLAGNFDIATTKEKTTQEIMLSVIDELESRSNSVDKISGLKTGFDCLDKRFRGFQNSDLIILAARPSMGKTTLAMNILESCIKNQKTALVFSMEMTSEQLMAKVICSIGGINYGNFRDGNLTDYEWTQVGATCKRIKDMNLIIDDRAGLSMPQIRAKAIRAKRKHKRVDLIAIDYVTLIKVPNKTNRTQEIGDISTALKGLAKEMNCPVLILSQLNRNLEARSDKRPIMADLRDSGQLEQDADVIMFIYRDDVYNKNGEVSNIAEIITAKNRHGEIGTDRLKTELDRSRFVNLDTNFTFKPIEQKQRPTRKTGYDDLDS